MFALSCLCARARVREEPWAAGSDVDRKGHPQRGLAADLSESLLMHSPCPREIGDFLAQNCP